MGPVLVVFVAERPDGAQFACRFAHFHVGHVGFICGEASLQGVDHRLFGWAVIWAFWHGFAEFRAAEFCDARDEIAEDVGEVRVYGGLEIIPCEFTVRGFWGV